MQSPQSTANISQTTDSRFPSPVLQPSASPPNLDAVKQRKQNYTIVDGDCAGPELCPLSQIKVGVVVCIKRLDASPELTDRLRELGFCEQQRIKLLRRHPGVICQVCDARLALSDELAESIFVEKPPDHIAA